MSHNFPAADTPVLPEDEANESHSLTIGALDASASSESASASPTPLPDDDEFLAELAALTPPEYDRVRKEAAKRFGVQVSSTTTAEATPRAAAS